MMLSKGITAVGITKVALLCVSIAVCAQAQENYKTRLSPVPIANASGQATVAGVGSVTAVLSGAKLAITGTFEGLRSAATTARLYQGIVMGARGPAIGNLTVTQAAGGSISGSFELTKEQIESLKKNRLYIQIDSEKAPEGNLWGWLTR
jgi:hypothetical protein